KVLVSKMGVTEMEVHQWIQFLSSHHFLVPFIGRGSSGIIGIQVMNLSHIKSYFFNLLSALSQNTFAVIYQLVVPFELIQRSHNPVRNQRFVIIVVFQPGKVLVCPLVISFFVFNHTSIISGISPMGRRILPFQLIKEQERFFVLLCMKIRHSQLEGTFFFFSSGSGVFYGFFQIVNRLGVILIIVKMLTEITVNKLCFGMFGMITRSEE